MCKYVCTNCSQVKILITFDNINVLCWNVQIKQSKCRRTHKKYDI